MDKLFAVADAVRRRVVPEPVAITTTEMGMFATREPERVKDFVRVNGLITPGEALIRCEDISPWIRVGGETYQAVSRIQTENETKYVVAKSIYSVDRERGNSMLKNRAILEEAGVRVPQLLHTEMSGDGQRA